MPAIFSPRRSRAVLACVSTADSRSRSIMLSRNTSTARAMAPISSWAAVAGMAAEVSPSASFFIAPASSSSGRVIERPMRQLQPMPISTTAKPTQRMKLRMRAREAASAPAASSALSRAEAMILSASGSTVSVSWAISPTSGSILSVEATHWAKAKL